MERHATAGKRVYAKSVSRVRIPLAPQDKRRIFKQLRKFGAYRPKGNRGHGT